MTDARIHELSTTATSLNSGDYFVIDNSGFTAAKKFDATDVASFSGGGEYTAQVKVNQDWDSGDLDTVALRLRGSGNDNTQAWPLLEVYADADGTGAGYDGEAHIFMRAGVTSNERRYINFREYDNTSDNWIFGVNASDAMIFYDSNDTVHRIWMDDDATGSGDTWIAPAGSGRIRLNYHQTDTVGTGSTYFYVGGAPANNNMILSVGVATPGNADTATTVIVNAGKTAAQNGYFYFQDQSSSKWYLGKHSSNAFALYDVANTQYALWATATSRVGLFTVSPAATLHVDQTSATGAIPVLYLDQADVSEEFIEFNTTIGTGNAIEAVGAKTLTTTHFVKVTITGVGIRYIPVGTIA